MPELPEVETIARDLHGALAGAVIRSAKVVRRDVLRGTTAPGLDRALRGATITRVFRRAKSAVIEAGEARLVVAPRFTGAVLIDAPGDPYACAVLTLRDGRTVTYADVRRLGTLTLFDRRSYARWSATIGPEPLDADFTAERLADIVRGSARAVKTILMDQKRLAGVGNIYANEALWMARVRPARPGRTVTRAACTRLHRAVVDVLRDALARRGTTFRDFRDPYGDAGGFVHQLAAYGRGGHPCRRCKTTLKASHAIDGRQTVWCPRCQA